MKTISTTIILIAVCLLTACQTATVEMSTVPFRKLDRGVSVYVVTPADGSYGRRSYAGSGEFVSGSFGSALAPYADSVIIGQHQSSTAEVLAAAREKRCVYVVIPEITRWEDRATEWSGIRDKMELFVKILRVEDGAEVASAEIKGRSAWATFGGDHPQDLVMAPVKEFIRGLF
jgi:hypothetical protein